MGLVKLQIVHDPVIVVYSLLLTPKSFIVTHTYTYTYTSTYSFSIHVLNFILFYSSFVCGFGSGGGRASRAHCFAPCFENKTSTKHYQFRSIPLPRIVLCTVFHPPPPPIAWKFKEAKEKRNIKYKLLLLLYFFKKNNKKCEKVEKGDAPFILIKISKSTRISRAEFCYKTISERSIYTHQLLYRIKEKKRRELSYFKFFLLFLFHIVNLKSSWQVNTVFIKINQN